MRQRLRRALLIGVGVLYLLSIPWYREAGNTDWVAVAIGCYVGAAVLNALAWLLTDIDEDGT